MQIEAKLEALGLTLPELFTPPAGTIVTFLVGSGSRQSSIYFWTRSSKSPMARLHNLWGE